jgi:hypothetical protein
MPEIKEIYKRYYTRSMAKKFLESYSFDASSKEWSKNKVKNKYNHYTYKNDINN